MSEPLSENPQRQKPQRERQQYDDTDLRLNAALQAVDVPVGLRARLVQSVELASNELVAHELAAHELANQELATRELVPVELLNTNGLMNPAHVPSQTAGVTMQLETRFGPHAGKSRRLSRRSVIAAAIAAGIGGLFLAIGNSPCRSVKRGWLRARRICLTRSIEALGRICQRRKL